MIKKLLLPNRSAFCSLPAISVLSGHLLFSARYHDARYIFLPRPPAVVCTRLLHLLIPFATLKTARPYYQLISETKSLLVQKISRHTGLLRTIDLGCFTCESRLAATYYGPDRVHFSSLLRLQARCGRNLLAVINSEQSFLSLPPPVCVFLCQSTRLLQFLPPSNSSQHSFDRCTVNIFLRPTSSLTHSFHLTLLRPAHIHRHSISPPLGLKHIPRCAQNISLHEHCCL